MSQQELAVRAKMSIGTIVMIERYGYLPGPRVRGRIAEAMGLTLPQLWPDSSYMPGSYPMTERVAQLLCKQDTHMTGVGYEWEGLPERARPGLIDRGYYRRRAALILQLIRAEHEQEIAKARRETVYAVEALMESEMLALWETGIKNGDEAAPRRMVSSDILRTVLEDPGLTSADR